MSFRIISQPGLKVSKPAQYQVIMYPTTKRAPQYCCFCLIAPDFQKEAEESQYYNTGETYKATTWELLNHFHCTVLKEFQAGILCAKKYALNCYIAINKDQLH